MHLINHKHQKKVGNCQSCGSSIYGPRLWESMDPPPILFTCNCRFARPNLVIIDGDILNPKEELTDDELLKRLYKFYSS